MLLARFHYQTVFASQINPVKYVLSLMLGYLMISLHLNIWKVKIWLSQEWEKLSKWNKKICFLVSQVPSFRLTKQTCKNVTDTNFKYQWKDGILNHKL